MSKLPYVGEPIPERVDATALGGRVPVLAVHQQRPDLAHQDLGEPVPERRGVGVKQDTLFFLCVVWVGGESWVGGCDVTSYVTYMVRMVLDGGPTKGGPRADATWRM